MNKKIILSREEARALEDRAIHEFEIPSIILMENAGRNAADYLLSHHPRGEIVICCGKGNNGGDGFVIARHLDDHGIPTHIILFANPAELSGDAKINYDIIVNSSLPMTIAKEGNQDSVVQRINSASWIVDALFGTGLNSRVKPPYDNIIRLINEARKIVLSVDIPSGLDCDTGEPLGEAIKAAYTVTFVGYKKGFNNPKAREYLGEIHIADIGIPKRAISK